MAKTKSSCERSLDWLRRKGWTAQVVEQAVRPPGRPMFRRDLFGVADILAMDGAGKLLAVQATSHGARSQHLDTLENAPLLAQMTHSAIAVELHCWTKAKPGVNRNKPKFDRYAVDTCPALPCDVVGVVRELFVTRVDRETGAITDKSTRRFHTPIVPPTAEDCIVLARKLRYDLTVIATGAAKGLVLDFRLGAGPQTFDTTLQAWRAMYGRRRPL